MHIVLLKWNCTERQQGGEVWHLEQLLKQWQQRQPQDKQKTLGDNNSFHPNIHLALRQIVPLWSTSITYILEFSAAVASPGDAERETERERQWDWCYYINITADAQTPTPSSSKNKNLLKIYKDQHTAHSTLAFLGLVMCLFTIFQHVAWGYVSLSVCVSASGSKRTNIPLHSQRQIPFHQSIRGDRHHSCGQMVWRPNHLWEVQSGGHLAPHVLPKWEDQDLCGVPHEAINGKWNEAVVKLTPTHTCVVETEENQRKYVQTCAERG